MAAGRMTLGAAAAKDGRAARAKEEMPLPRKNQLLVLLAARPPHHNKARRTEGINWGRARAPRDAKKEQAMVY
jgi:hypothetical protein